MAVQGHQKFRGPILLSRNEREDRSAGRKCPPLPGLEWCYDVFHPVINSWRISTRWAVSPGWASPHIWLFLEDSLPYFGIPRLFIVCSLNIRHFMWVFTLTLHSEPRCVCGHFPGEEMTAPHTACVGTEKVLRRADSTAALQTLSLPAQKHQPQSHWSALSTRPASGSLVYQRASREMSLLCWCTGDSRQGQFCV